MGLLKRCLALNPRHQEALHLFYRLQEQGQEQEQESGASSYPVAKDQVTPPSASYWLRSNRIHRERWNETARNWIVIRSISTGWYLHSHSNSTVHKDKSSGAHSQLQLPIQLINWNLKTNINRRQPNWWTSGLIERHWVYLPPIYFDYSTVRQYRLNIVNGKNSFSSQELPPCVYTDPTPSLSPFSLPLPPSSSPASPPVFWKQYEWLIEWLNGPSRIKYLAEGRCQRLCVYHASSRAHACAPPRAYVSVSGWNITDV